MGKICRDCGDEFKIKISKKGFINQCDDCSESDKTQRFIGYNDGSLNKSTNISLYKGGDPEIIKKLNKKMGRVGGF